MAATSAAHDAGCANQWRIVRPPSSHNDAQQAARSSGHPLGQCVSSRATMLATAGRVSPIMSRIPSPISQTNSGERGGDAAALGGGGGYIREEGAAAFRSSRVRKSQSQNPPQVLNTLSLVSVQESRIQYLCDPQWFKDTASRGPTTIVAPESQFRTCPSDHDSIGYPRMSASGESSTTMHRLLHASGPHPIPPPNDPKAPETDLFGLQCPTSPLLPPRKVPLEDLIYTSCTDPIPQPAAARTPRLHQPSTVTHLFYAYVRKATNAEFNVVVLGRDLICIGFEIHSLYNFAQLS
ncbi:hypothetical protein F511_41148 [Dorcoceras hygrometricum]|uniref:Uncharacterized protein n=1 Tax=Dorcoceras hygrometricum TaxID=472368 RepID=A0A2Z7BH19_9LAMI|nr:hypothetical protein F511_41148 [Dorcoceras hygrometricum]